MRSPPSSPSSRDRGARPWSRRSRRHATSVTSPRTSPTTTRRTSRACSSGGSPSSAPGSTAPSSSKAPTTASCGSAPTWRSRTTRASGCRWRSRASAASLPTRRWARRCSAHASTTSSRSAPRAARGTHAFSRSAAADMPRCFGDGNPLYERYHDEEWGFPVRDERALYERLVLEAFQSGLAWITILRKRDNFRAAFAGFDPEAVARFEERDVERLLGDAGIVRNRAKIEAAIAKARATIELGSLDSYLWDFVGGGPIRNAWHTLGEIPAETEES